MKPIFVSVAGTMGSGKTTAARIIAEGLKMHLIEENFGANEFLPLFYQDMKKWAFFSQAFFLTEKVKQVKTIAKLISEGNTRGAIQDTPLKQDVFSYARALYLQGYIAENQYRLYMKIFDTLTDGIPEPDYYIFLKTKFINLTARIIKRSRNYELGVSEKYLRLLDKENKNWLSKINKQKLIIINTDEADFSSNAKAKLLLIEQVKKALKIEQ